MIFAAVLAACGIAHHLLAAIAVQRFRPRKKTRANSTPPVSILKPIRGRDARFYDAIRSHALLEYPAFEILFGATANDPALEDIARLRREFPAVSIRVIDTANDAPNGKAGSLEILAREAKHEVFIVNDSDIRVEPNYLDKVITALNDENAGLVTCLYRGAASSWAAKVEALGIATEFAPSVLVARILSDSAFALGSTMAFRRDTLNAIGGFQAVREYLADDYQLGARIATLGKKVVLADTVVETNLGAGSLRDVWKHQVRWSRTIRVSRPWGYLGYLVTQLTFWSLVALVAGYKRLAAMGFAVRLISAAIALNRLDPELMLLLPAVPLRDLFGVAVWCAGMGGNKVEWRGIRFQLQSDGRIKPLAGLDQ
jgi:ceramide glucosyltransferase